MINYPPPFSNQPKPTLEQLIAIAGLIQTHLGRDHPIKSKDIGAAVGIFEKDSAGHMIIRYAVKNIIYRYRLPIGACHEGYYVLATERELYDYLNRLNFRANAILDRSRQVRYNFYNSVKQTTLGDTLH